MEQTGHDDSIAELYRPGKPGITDDDGSNGHTTTINLRNFQIEYRTIHKTLIL